ncbi:hypothetical protein ACOKM3_14130 [Streptomyces sp. BH106]|uniref:hypothetical protein n=1 Tax=Streptomyces sp. BH106 TaxID=3410409 RepID=UPI003CF7AD0A
MNQQPAPAPAKNIFASDLKFTATAALLAFVGSLALDVDWLAYVGLGFALSAVTYASAAQKFKRHQQRR